MKPLGQGFGKHIADDIQDWPVVEPLDGKVLTISCLIGLLYWDRNVHSDLMPLVLAEDVTCGRSLLFHVHALDVSIKAF